MSTDAMKDYAALLGGEAEEVGGRDEGDFAPNWEFRGGDSLLAGRYNGTREVQTENGPRTIHSFKDAATGAAADAMTPVEGGEIEAWGTTVLDDVLSEIAKGQKVLVVYEGRRDTGRKPHVFRAYRAKNAAAL